MKNWSESEYWRRQGQSKPYVIILGLDPPPKKITPVTESILVDPSHQTGVGRIMSIYNPFLSPFSSQVKRCIGIYRHQSKKKRISEVLTLFGANTALGAEKPRHFRVGHGVGKNPGVNWGAEFGQFDEVIQELLGDSLVKPEMMCHFNKASCSIILGIFPWSWAGTVSLTWGMARAAKLNNGAFLDPVQAYRKQHHPCCLHVSCSCT